MEKKNYMNPYLAGIGLGLTLLLAFVLVGRGLGASGALMRFTAWITSFPLPNKEVPGISGSITNNTINRITRNGIRRNVST